MADSEKFTKTIVQNLANHTRGSVRVPVFSSRRGGEKKRGSLTDRQKDSIQDNPAPPLRYCVRNHAQKQRA